jgi:hypothetical protein
MPADLAASPPGKNLATARSRESAAKSVGDDIFD